MEITIEKEIKSGIEKVFSMFIIKSKLETWLCSKAVIEPKINGKFELYFDKNDFSRHNTIGCKITNIVFNKFISIEWKAPKSFSFINISKPLTLVNMYFTEINNNTTNIKLVHTGFKNNAKWLKAMQWFSIAWQESLTLLQHSCSKTIQINKW